MDASGPLSPIEKFVRRAGSLYSLPAVAVEVLRLTSSPSADAAELKACIERDPALVGKILRTVNSSLFGGPRNVSELGQAVTLLGIKPLKLLVLSFSLPPKLLSGSQQQSLRQYWQHALSKAVAARELAPHYRVDADDAFLAGLLQDIGMLVLLKDLGQPYAMFLEKARKEQADLLMLELNTLAFDHRLLSARLLADWGLPESLWRMVAARLPDGEAGADVPPGDLARLLETAEAVAQLLAEGRPERLAAIMAQSGGWNVRQWTDFAGSLQEKIGEIAGIFEIGLLDGADYEQLVFAAHARLAREAEDAAASLARAADGSLWDETRQLASAAQAVPAAPPTAREPGDDSLPRRGDAGRPARSSALSAASTSSSLLADPGLLGGVERAVAGCRRRREPLSLLLIALDEFEEIAFEAGADAATQSVRRLRQAVERVLESAGAALVYRDGQIAVLLPNADRASAVAAARYLLQQARCGRLADHPAGKISLSIGLASVALPAKNFPAESLVEAAERCLFGVQASGGDGVKSIDIY